MTESEAKIELDLLNNTVEILCNTVELNTASDQYCLPLKEKMVYIQECNIGYEKANNESLNNKYSSKTTCQICSL